MAAGVAVAGSGCATPHTIADDPFDLAETSAAPEISAVVDIGGGARWLALSSDGRAAYVAGPQTAAIDVVDLPAPGTPKTIYRLDLGRGGAIRGLAAAARATVLAVVRERDLMLVDTSSPLHPARSAPRPLPPELRDARLVAVDLSPDGKLLAVATEAGNQIVLLDL